MRPIKLSNLAGNRSFIIKSIYESCISEGYFYLCPEPFLYSDHLLKSYFQLKEFHNLSPRIKQKYRTDLNKNSRGWVPMFTEPSYEPGKISYVESFDIALDLDEKDPLANSPHLGPNVWPNDELINFKETISKIYENTTTISNILFELFAESVSLPKNSFLQYATRARRSHMRLLHYPGKDIVSDEMKSAPLSNDVQKNYTIIAKNRGGAYATNIVEDIEDVGISAHTDFECFTLLHQDAPGLQVQDRHGNWVTVNPPLMSSSTNCNNTTSITPCFTVIIGDMIERWTNGVYLATPHRVPMTKHRRHSIVRFNGIDSDVLVTPLQPFITNESESMKKYPPVTQGDHIDKMMRKGLHNLEEIQKFGVLPNI